MSNQEKCPGCGAGWQNTTHDNTMQWYECESSFNTDQDRLHRSYLCIDRQLAQAQAEIERLTKLVNAYYNKHLEGFEYFGGLCYCSCCLDVRIERKQKALAEATEAARRET